MLVVTLKQNIGALFIIILAFAACAPRGPVDSTATAHALPRAADWSPRAVRLECPSGDCPGGIGLFVWVGENDAHEQTITRCSATLIAPDQVLTNAHCANSASNEGYFFARDEHGQTQVRRLGARQFSIQQESFKVDERDLAAWTLDSPMTEVTPRQVARSLPAHLDTLVAYVVNLDAGAEWETQFRIDRRECRTQARVALLDAGVEDRSSRLALFGCNLKPGNSGSALFVPGDLNHIQVVFNSIANFDPGAKRYGNIFDSLFAAEVPDYLNKYFALAERVHCLEIPGQTRAESSCAKPKTFKEAVAPAVEELLAAHYQRVEISNGIVWGERALSTEVARGQVQAVSFIPVPICVQTQPDAPVSGTESGSIQFRVVPTYRFGVDRDNRARVLEGTPREYLYRIERTGEKVSVVAVSKLDRYAFLDEAAVKRAEGSTPVPPCETASVEADLKKARLAFAGTEFPPLPDEDLNADF